MAIRSEQHQLARQAYLWLVAAVYLFAFASLYTQVPGLYGPQGLTPVRNVLPRLEGNKSLVSQFREFPSLLLFHEYLQLSPSVAMEMCCVGGVVLAGAALVFRAMRCSLIFLLLWLLYLSLYKVGQVFLWFQWDILLLETGFLTALVAPFNLLFWRKPVARSHDGLTLWLVRWLLFRLMFASGVVKLTSQCPTWWGLTALNIHYESQCIPTPLSWYAHQLPPWVHSLSVVATYLIETGTPFLFFAPLRSLRLAGFWCQVFLQVLIIASGNYNFFNLLTIALCFSLLDDCSLGKKSATSYKTTSQGVFSWIFGGRRGNKILSVLKGLIFLSVCGFLLAATVYYFTIQFTSLSSEWPFTATIRFSPAAFERGLAVAVPLAAILGSLSLLLEILHSLYRSLLHPGVVWRVWSVLQSSAFSLVALLLFIASLVTLAPLSSSFSQSLPSDVVALHSRLDHYSIAHSYGLFRRMTGTDGRPELVIEGTNDVEEGVWKEYDFLYKPGNVYGAPVYVAPHQPRLDWQMWFAALGHYQSNPWLVHLVYRLLIGQREVIKLMAPPPFETPPKYIRVQLYHYHYTDYNRATSIVNQTAAWWKRDFKAEYIFPMNWDHQGLADYLSKYNYLSQSSSSPAPDTPLSSFLAVLRGFADQHSPPSVLWALFSTAFIASLTMSFMFPDAVE